MLGFLLAIGMALWPAVTLPARATERFPGAEWHTTTPAEAGWSTEKLDEARQLFASLNSSAVMIVHHGLVVQAWGDTAARVNLHSVRKSLLSALIGMAVAEGRIDIADTMEKLGIDDNAPSLTPEEKQATIEDLLKSRSGVYHAALYETPEMAAARPARGSHARDTFWYYNNWDFNALGTIYERATGASIYRAIANRIAGPIGMQDFRPEDGFYVRGDASIHAAYPLRMSARDLARFALLYMHGGKWHDRQLVPADWVKASTRAYSFDRRGSGYGYLWWTGPRWAPEGSFFASGHGGQWAFVIPALDLIIVHRYDLERRGFVPDYEGMSRLMRLILAAAPH